MAWWITDQMEQGILPFNADWMEFVIQRPAQPTIDAGRESRSNIDEYDKGFMSGLEIAGERGQNIYRVLRQKAREVKYAHELAKEFGVPVEQIIKLDKAGAAPNPNGQPPPNNQPGNENQNEDDDDEKPNQPSERERTE